MYVFAFLKFKLKCWVPWNEMNRKKQRVKRRRYENRKNLREF